MVKISPSKIFIPNAFQYYLEKPTLVNSCFPLFPLPFWNSNFITFIFDKTPYFLIFLRIKFCLKVGLVNFNICEIKEYEKDWTFLKQL